MWKKADLFKIFCLQIQYLDLSMLLQKIICYFIHIKSMDLILEAYPNGCYLLAFGDLQEMQPEQGPQLAKREDEVAPGDSTALLATRFTCLVCNLTKKIFLLLIGFSETPQTASEADTWNDSTNSTHKVTRNNYLKTNDIILAQITESL